MSWRRECRGRRSSRHPRAQLPQYFEVELAAAKLGVIVAALNWRLGARELTHCVQLVRPRMLIVQAELVAGIASLDLPSMDRRSSVTATSRRSPRPRPATARSISIENRLVILCTSGTTGLPKELDQPSRHVRAWALLRVEFEVPIGDHFVAWAPLYHMASTDRVSRRCCGAALCTWWMATSPGV